MFDVIYTVKFLFCYNVMMLYFQDNLIGFLVGLLPCLSCANFCSCLIVHSCNLIRLMYSCCDIIVTTLYCCVISHVKFQFSRLQLHSLISKTTIPFLTDIRLLQGNPVIQYALGIVMKLCITMKSGILCIKVFKLS